MRRRILTHVVFQVDAFEREVLDVLSLIRSWRNRFAPINRIPPEVLTLIPDFWDGGKKEKATITLTHVCRVWREMFASRSSLWTNFNCADAEKTRVYLERSKSSPINLRLDRKDGLFPHDPFLQIVPHAVGRFKCLFISTTPDHLQDITDYLSHPAPLLEDLTILAAAEDPSLTTTFATTLFDGDLSSLHDLCLYSVHTELPWRNMVNLTRFALGYLRQPGVTIGQLLDFFESAPHLLDVQLAFANPIGVQKGRLVSLAHLRKLLICGSNPSSSLLDHLLIPVGARMTTDLESPGPQIEEHLPRSLDNLKNLSGFTKICLHFDRRFTSVTFNGPNGQVCMSSMFPDPDTTRLVPRSLALLDTSKTERLEIIRGDPLVQDLHQAFLPLTNLRTLALYLCKNLHSLILALFPNPNSTNSIPCPKLERLVFRTERRFDIEVMGAVAEARGLLGAPLRSVKIISHGELVSTEGVIKLQEYVLHVETHFEVIDEDYGLYDEIPEDSDEEGNGDSDDNGDDDNNED